MSDEISQVVEVYISRETAQIDTASFDIPLLLVNLPDTVDNTDPQNPITTPADVSNRVQVFTSLSAVGVTFGTTSVAYTMAQKLLGNDIRPVSFMIGIKNSVETYTEALNDILEVNSSWYMLAIDSKSRSNIEEVAAIIQAQYKMFAASTADVAVADPTLDTDVGTFLMESGYDRTFLVYHPMAATQFPEIAWMGGQLPEVPGSNTWAFKSGAGVTVSRLSPTQITALESKNVNYYTRLGGVNLFRTGATSEGEWIDVMILVDWIRARIQEQVFFRFATKKKIPFTQAGALMIEAEIRSVLSQGVANGGIAADPSYTVISPDVLNIPEVQRNLRVMGDFTFRARLAGAVHKTIIRGVVNA